MAVQACNGSEPFAGEHPRLLGDPITVVGLILESAAGLNRVLSPSMERFTGVSGQASGVLIRLYRSPGGSLRMSDLAGQTGLTRSGLTRAIDRLIEADLCSRETCDQDRRGIYATLTDKGRAIVRDALALHEHEINELLSSVLTHDEESFLVDLLTKVRDRVHPDAALLSTEQDYSAS